MASITKNPELKSGGTTVNSNGASNFSGKLPAATTVNGNGFSNSSGKLPAATTVNDNGFSNSSGKIPTGTTVNDAGFSNSSGKIDGGSAASGTGSNITHADPALALAQAAALANAKPTPTPATTVNDSGYSHSAGKIDDGTVPTGSGSSGSGGNDLDDMAVARSLTDDKAAATAPKPNNDIFINSPKAGPATSAEDGSAKTSDGSTPGFPDILNKALGYIGGASSGGATDTGSGGTATGGASGGTGATGTGASGTGASGTGSSTGADNGYTGTGAGASVAPGTPSATVNTGTATDLQAIVDAFKAANDNAATANGSPSPSGAAPDVQAIIDAYKAANASSGDVKIDSGKAVDIPETPDLKPLLEQWRAAAEQQQTNQIDYATQQGINELQRAQEDAQAQFRAAQEQISAEEAINKDNQALYAEARGDKGGIGAAQYDTIMNTAAINRQAVREQQTKLATDTWRQIADLRAQGEYQKADAVLQVAQTYLSNLMSLEQWAANYGLSAAQMQESIREWEANYKAQIAELLGSYDGQKTLAARTSELNADMQAAQIAESIREWENNYKTQMAQLMGSYDGQKTLAARSTEAELEMEAKKMEESIREWENNYKAQIADLTGFYNGQPTLSTRTAAANSNDKVATSKYGGGSTSGADIILSGGSPDTSGYSQLYTDARNAYLNGTMTAEQAAAIMEAANKAANEARGLGSIVTAASDIAGVRNGTLKA